MKKVIEDNGIVQWLMHEMPVILFMSLAVYIVWKRYVKEAEYSKEIAAKSIETMVNLNHIIDELFSKIDRLLDKEKNDK